MTRDGGRVVAVWESPCIICGEPFTVTTSPSVASIDQSPAFSVMTCREHRLWPYESQKIWLAKPEDRREVFEEIKRKSSLSCPGRVFTIPRLGGDDRSGRRPTRRHHSHARLAARQL
jgi:hypothetical protein